MSFENYKDIAYEENYKKNILLYKKERKKYFDSLDLNKITDNKAFWENIQALFSKNEKLQTK